MKRKSYSLVSKGFKALSILLTISLISLSIVLIIYKAVWYAVFFSCLIAVVCLFTTFLSFLNKIVVDIKKGQLKIYSFTRRKINLNELQSVEIDTNNSIDKEKYCYILFKLVDGTVYKISGYTTFFYRKAVYYTQKEIDDLNHFLGLDLS